MEANLPQQRCVLYERLAEAYLESIDERKGISESTLNLPRKKAWLARVGYEMQQRRQRDGEDGLLHTSDDVLHWIGNEMERGRAFMDVPTPAEFLSFVGRHGGLFVLQGDDQYAFSHLSFQDYFAALAIEGEVTGFKWAKSGRSSLGFGRTDVAAWARQSAWLETFCFLFEMLADRPEWHGETAELRVRGRFRLVVRNGCRRRAVPPWTPGRASGGKSVLRPWAMRTNVGPRCVRPSASQMLGTSL